MLALLLPFLCMADPGPAGPSALAPGFEDLEGAMATLEAQADRAEASQVATARIHNRLAERLASGQEVPCDDIALLPLLGRTPPLLAAWRASAQTARMDLARLERLARSATLAPVLDARTRARIEALEERVRPQASTWLEASAWQSRFVAPILERCRPALVPGPGLPDPLDPDRPAQGSVAILGVGGGRVCPVDLPADGSVVVLPSPEACYGPEDCACFGEPVLPGAVLGPTPDRPSAVAPPAGR
ncbi:MAG: hypothetical protein JXB39_02550 [Deltaproteobacteria bacterium]|nr:hypothetical protein [Deltaproteobacteria bacterium]